MPTVSFTIDGTSYTALEGMTWEKWVNSGYNTGGILVNGDWIGNDSDNRMLWYSDDTAVDSSDIIKSDAYYFAYEL